MSVDYRPEMFDFANMSDRPETIFDGTEILHCADKDLEWWRSAVIYQVYPRSFKDLSGDGIGDLPGITSGLTELSELDIDAIWISPFYRSPQKDGGYDVSDYCDVDPVFGTLEDFDHLVEKATSLGIRVIIDLVPNHCSNENVLFQAALHAGAGSSERDMFIFRDGHGEHGELPPNNWQSHFGGPAWTRVFNEDGTAGQWYLHLFDTSQPDFNWDNPAVHAEFERILHFWLQRGVSGFRVDVAHALVKAQGLPDWGGRANGKSSDGFPGYLAPMFGQDAVHDIFRKWRKILDSYEGEKILCAEANVDPVERVADWVRKDEMHQAFNFPYLNQIWDAEGLKEIITSSLKSFDSVGAPTTWVLSNHDKVRHTTRFGLSGRIPRHGDGIGPSDPQPDHAIGSDRGRAASLLMLALPGGVYLYQGEELGLPDHTSLPDVYRQDPTFYRTEGKRMGRDGCRVPLPWTKEEHSFGFSLTGESWLPQPADWAILSREAQREDPNSTLNMYRVALENRRELALGSGSFAWVPQYSNDTALAFLNGGTLVIINMGIDAVPVPDAPIIVASELGAGQRGVLQPNQCIWLDVSMF